MLFIFKRSQIKEKKEKKLVTRSKQKISCTVHKQTKKIYSRECPNVHKRL